MGKKKKMNQNNHYHHNSNQQSIGKKEESLNDSIHSNVRHPVSLVEILDKFRRSVGRLGNGQQDAQEFLGYIIANLHEEMTWNSIHRNANGTVASSVSSCTVTAKHENGQNDDVTECKEDDLNGNTINNLNIDNQQNEENAASTNSNNQKGWTLVTKNVH